MEANKKRIWLIEGSSIYSLHHSWGFKKGLPEMCNEFYFSVQPDYARDITNKMAEQQAKEIHTAINGYDSLLEENKRLKEALKEFLNSINRSDTALQHYGNAIKLAENILSKSTVKEDGNNG